MFVNTETPCSVNAPSWSVEPDSSDMEKGFTIPDAANGWFVPWNALQRFDWVRAWHGCIQDPFHHAEGDVWLHTKMVLEEMVADQQWRNAPCADREIAYIGALLHDVAKPSTTRMQEDGRVTARGHSRRGAIDARRILWQLGYPFAVREAVCALIRYHQVPYFLIDEDNARLRLARISQTARCDLLQRLALADIKGRVCGDLERILHNIELFGLLAEESGCLQAPMAFSSAHARVAFFRGKPWALTGEVFDDTYFEVTLMCGLPGAGKDRWIREFAPGLPVVSLDAIRAQLGVDPRADQGPVRQAAQARAREYLRRGQPFVWNATNLPAQRRALLLDLFHGYRARTRIVYVESPAARLFQQNRARRQVVPEKVIRGMMRSWEVPDLTEAHRVEYAVTEERSPGMPAAQPGGRWRIAERGDQ